MSLAVALAALFIAPYFAYRKTVAEMRQAWINDLRDCVAELLSLASIPEIALAHRDADADISPRSLRQNDATGE
jgi:hypothetical protein